jgi:hypothetical protein
MNYRQYRLFALEAAADSMVTEKGQNAIQSH